MSNNFYGAIDFSGGSDGFLDNIDGTNLADVDGAWVVTADPLSGIYILDADSAAAQVVPTIISPDANAGNKRWLLAGLQMTSLKLYEAGTTNLVNVSQTSGNLTVDNTYDGGLITLLGENTGDSTMLVADPAGSVDLYNSGTKIVSSVATGLQAAIAAFQLLTSGGEVGIEINNNGNVELYFNNIIEGETVSGALKATNALQIGASALITGFTGADTTLVSGTAGTDQYLAKWNTDGDIVDAVALATVGQLGVAAEWTKQQNFNEAGLTDGATINWDCDDYQVATVTLGGNRTMAAPTNQNAGGTYILQVVQDATGSRTLSWNAVFKWESGTAPTLASAANERTIIMFKSDGTNMYGASFWKEN